MAIVAIVLAASGLFVFACVLTSDLRASGVDRVEPATGGMEMFKLPIGHQDGSIWYEEGCGDSWGRNSFAMLGDGTIAVLDGADRQIEIVTSKGVPVKTLAIPEVISPLEIREWSGCLAVLDGCGVPSKVVVFDQEGNEVRRIALPQGLAEISPAMRVGDRGELQLLETSVYAHLVIDARGNKGPAEVRNQSLSLQGFGPLDIIVDASTEESLRQPVTLATATATRVFANDQRVPFGVRPLAGDGHGNLVCEVKYRELAGSSSVFDRQVQVGRGDTLELVASARVPLEDYYVAPKRLIDIGPDGSIWCMVPERDGVSFRVLDLQPGALAPRIQTQAADIGEHVATWFHSFVSGVRGAVHLPEAQAAIGYTHNWSERLARSKAVSYWSINWYCNEEAFYRSCNIPLYNRPRFMTTYNVTYPWTPYAWAAWHTTSTFLGEVGSPGHDAGDRKGDHPKLPCVYGVDCSGLAARCWGLTGSDADKPNDASEERLSILGRLPDGCAHQEWLARDPVRLRGRWGIRLLRGHYQQLVRQRAPHDS